MGLRPIKRPKVGPNETHFFLHHGSGKPSCKRPVLSPRQACSYSHLAVVFFFLFATAGLFLIMIHAAMQIAPSSLEASPSSLPHPTSTACTPSTETTQSLPRPCLLFLLAMHGPSPKSRLDTLQRQLAATPAQGMCMATFRAAHATDQHPMHRPS